MQAEAIERAARELWSVRLQGRTIDALPADCRPPTVEDGYAVQLAVAEIARRAGTEGPRVGWKIAATTSAARTMLGVEEPLSGPLYERGQLAPGAETDLASVVGVVEAEFALTLGRDVAPGGAPFTAEDLRAAVASVHPAIELPGSRFADLGTAGPQQMVADDAGSGVFVIGPAASGVALDDLAGTAVSLRRDGAEVAAGSGSDVLGDPSAALAWLANRLALLGLSLTAGDVALTGAAALTREVAAGDHMLADFGAVGSVAVTLR